MADKVKYGKHDDVHSIMVPYSEIHWIVSRNKGRPTGDYGNLKELTESMFEHCYDKNVGKLAVVEKIDDKSKAEAIKEREETHAALKAASKADAGKLAELAAFEEMFCDGKGKIKAPTYLGVTANRRGQAFYKAMVMRRIADKPLDLMWPIEVRIFASESERLLCLWRENVGHTVGFLEPSRADYLTAVDQFMKLGEKQSFIRDQLGATKGVQAWFICVFNERFPKLRILERLLKKPTDPDYVDIKKLNYRALQGLNKRLEGKAEPPLGSAELETFFSGKAPAPDFPKGFEKDTKSALAKNHGSHAIRAAFTADAVRNKDLLDKWAAVSEVTNLAGRAYDEGWYGELEKLVVEFAQKHPPKEDSESEGEEAAE